MHGLDQLHLFMWPNMCHLDRPIWNLSCYTFPFRTLSIVYRVTDMVMVDQSGHFRLITTNSACVLQLYRKSTYYHFYCTKMFITCQRCITIMYAIDQTVFGFCFTFPTTWQFHFFSTSNKLVKLYDFLITDNKITAQLTHNVFITLLESCAELFWDKRCSNLVATFDQIYFVGAHKETRVPFKQMSN